MDLDIGISHRVIPPTDFLIVHLAQILPASVTGLVRIVDGGRDADTRRRFAVKIAQVVRHLLECSHAVRFHREYLVQQDEVMSWACGSRDCGVRLEEEVPVAVLGDDAVDELLTFSVVSKVLIFGTRGCVMYLQCRTVGCSPFPSKCYLRPPESDKIEYDGVFLPR